MLGEVALGEMIRWNVNTENAQDLVLMIFHLEKMDLLTQWEEREEINSTMTIPDLAHITIRLSILEKQKPLHTR